ncbi:DNA mismatch repair protein MutS2 [Melghirimyces profundicolus]|uniref:Endonuclease MutS2 n=1 Tax=Melghirimyces profundicolus TaxID=1242148 RepID=A0A2T6BT94_9BACL|nr:endonuclease MutS2 [Melghirimyces profundicolus]PTX59310.1 DNA mismatch repair protein MutS2 [Melghirimyces profundicolus]
MDSHMLHTLEYDRIIRQLTDEASSETGKKRAEEIRPSFREDEVRQMLQSTAEAMDFLRLKGDLSLQGVRDIRSALRRARLGSVLSSSELLHVAGTAEAEKTVRAALSGIDEEDVSLPILLEMTGRLAETRQLAQSISSAINEDGRVMDDASPELGRIRRNMIQLQGSIRSTLNEILRSSKYQKMLQEPIVTQRNDRYVIPVKQEYRGAFSGIVHDQSASGQTLFIEPQSVVNQNNRLRELEMAEEREVERILGELTVQVSELGEELEHNLEILTELDLLLAKARLGRRLKGVTPRVNTDGVIFFRKARHPLIPEEEAVPIDVELGREYRAIVITGPNTGGKTVSLKTVGLLTLMAQSGLPIPVEEESSVAVFSGVFADIGDEQSIEQNLSTFSAHMTNIIRILDQIDERSLVLFDELGAGTDPTEGAALAIAILEQVLNKGCRIVATTHYNELKLFAHAREGVINASVEFDVETLSPTYRLLIGVPGRSNAFEIAERLGLSREIIGIARSQLSSEENRLEDMIGALTADYRKAEEEREEAEALRREAEDLHRELKRQLETWENEKERLRESARREAKTIVTRARREAEEVLEQLREWARERPGELKEHQLIEAKKRLKEAEPETSLRVCSREESGPTRKIEVGDEVLIKSLGQKGQVIDELGEDEFQVQAGFMKMKVRAGDLEWKSSPRPEQTDRGSTSYRRSSNSVRHELDLRGKMVDEALPEIDKYLDDALLAGFDQVSLIHGKGTGALRTGVQKYLDRHPRVKKYRPGGQGEGGLGVTVVELK